MARQVINRGNFPNDHAHADPIYVINGKINDMTLDLYSLQSQILSAGDSRFSDPVLYPTTEARISAARVQAAIELKTIVSIPRIMSPFDASLVDFTNTTIRNVIEGGDYSIYDLRAYGASGDGGSGSLSYDLKAAAACYATVPAGAYVRWPSGTYLLTFATNGTPLITIPVANVHTILDPSTVIKMLAANAVTTKAQEQGQYLFTSTQSGHEFRGGTFDGNRNAVIDPDAAFFYGVQCSDITIQGMIFIDSSNNFGGVIQGTAWNGSTGVMLRNWKIKDNTFRRCAWCMHLWEWWYGIDISENTFEDLDLSDPNNGFAKLGDVAYSRAVRLTGYVNLTSSGGPIGNTTISRNKFKNCTYMVEVWNQDAANGRNPDSAELITVENNTGVALVGVGVNSYRDASISGNTWKRLKLSAAQMATYAGHSSITDTSTSVGWGIEARPGYNMEVTGNTLDGQWVSGESPDLTASVSGILAGNNGFNVRCEVNVTGNTIRACFAGFSFQDTQNSLVSANRVVECRRCFDIPSVGTNSFGRSRNTIANNRFVGLAAQAGVNIAVLRGDWTCERNTISGDPAGFATAAPIIIPDTAAITVVKGNTITHFLGAGIADQGLDSTYDDNTFDSKGSTSNGSIDFYRQNNKVVRIGRHTAIRCSAFFGWAQAAAAGESYTCGTVWCASIPGSGQNRAISGGTIADMAIEVAGAPSNAAPGAGAWSAGTRIWRNAPTASNPPGDVCVTSGTPGTWKAMANLAA